MLEPIMTMICLDIQLQLHDIFAFKLQIFFNPLNNNKNIGHGK